MEHQCYKAMKIQTNYNHKNSSPELLDYDNSVTEKNQYQPLSTMVRRASVGETLDVHDYSDDNPLDKMEKFDVLDMYLKLEPEEQARIKAEKEAKQKAAEEAYKAKIIEEYEKSKQQDAAE